MNYNSNFKILINKMNWIGIKTTKKKKTLPC